MLREIPETRQIRGEPRRRWFNSEFMDLYVWYDTTDEPLGFQLCYGKPNAERALTWFRPGNFSHMRVDHGAPEGSAFGGGTGTPLLVLDGLFEAPAVAREFARECRDLPGEIVALVAAKIEEYPLPDS
jgi:hypothetical protein